MISHYVWYYTKIFLKSEVLNMPYYDSLLDSYDKNFYRCHSKMIDRVLDVVFIANKNLLFLVLETYKFLCGKKISPIPRP